MQKKGSILLERAVSTSTTKNILKVVLVTKGKLKPDVNVISNLIRDEKYVDDKIHVFHLLWGLIWKILIGKYCEDSAWAGCLKLYDKKKSSKWFCSVCQKIIAMLTDSVVCERYLKWNHLSCTFLKKLPKVDIAILNSTSKIRIYLHLKNLQSSCEKNTHYYNYIVINKTIHKYILKKWTK